MKARISNPAMLLPDFLKAFQAAGKALEDAGVPKKTLHLVHLRVSQINGCAVCLDFHRHFAKDEESPERLMTVCAWRETPYFEPAERAALALAEHATRLADRGDAVPDAVWDEAAKHYEEKGLAVLVAQIALVNAFNRINAATRQIAGQVKWG